MYTVRMEEMGEETKEAIDSTRMREKEVERKEWRSRWLVTVVVVVLVGQFMWQWIFGPPLMCSGRGNEENSHEDEKRRHLAEAEVIVIGGGPAGSVIANQCSEKAGLKTVLIEAGIGSQRVLGGRDWLFRDRTVFDVPLAWSYVSQLKEYLWQVASGDIARALGGCGSHNAMLYVRAVPTDIERWNATSWDWETLYNQYLKLEDFQELNTKYFHSRGGPVAVSGNVVQDLLAAKFIETVKASKDPEVAMPILDDFNAPHTLRMGAGPYHFTIRDGIRESVAAVFLGGTVEGYAPIESLQVWTGLTVTRLVLDPDHKKVIALDLSRNSDALFSKKGTRSIRIPINPNATIVLTAGAVLTPHLLLASGIGPKEALKAKQLVNAPHIGIGLQDHPVVAMEFAVDAAITSDIATMFQDFLHWTKLGVSLASYSTAFSYPGFSLGAFIHSGMDPVPDPDIQLTIFPIQIEPHLAPDGKNSSASVHYDKALVTVALIRPETTYSVRVGSDGRPFFFSAPNSTYPKPPGTPNLTDRDIHRIAVGVRRVRKIFSQPPLSDFVISEYRPGNGVHTHEQLAQWVAAAFTQNAHYCCSVHFGPNKGALDPNTLKLKGLDNLYVADASAFPLIPNGNVHSTVTAVASEFADRITKTLLHRKKMQKQASHQHHHHHHRNS